MKVILKLIYNSVMCSSILANLATILLMLIVCMLGPVKNVIIIIIQFQHAVVRHKYIV